MDYLTYMWTNIIQQFYTTYISVDLAHHEIVRARVGKGGIKVVNHRKCTKSRMRVILHWCPFMPSNRKNTFGQIRYFLCILSVKLVLSYYRVAWA